MIIRLLVRAVWGTTKFTVKHVVVPIAMSAAVAAAATALAEKLREDAPAPNGHAHPVVATAHADPEE